jgi:hypothetical protein
MLKQLLFILLLYPLVSAAQKPLPYYQNDTLYTSCGYKIYKGATLYFGKGSGKDGKFRFVNVKSEHPGSFKLTGNTLVVKRMKNFGISVLGNAYIEIIGHIVYSDGSKGSIDIHMAFDNAIKSTGSAAGELLVPDEFKNN